MHLPELTPEQKIRRVSQMRRLGLSLREAYDKQYNLDKWLKRFEEFRLLPQNRLPASISNEDIAALRAGFKQKWVEKDFKTILDIAEKLPAGILSSDPMLAAFAGAAKDRIGSVEHSSV